MCHFFTAVKPLYSTWACYRNVHDHTLMYDKTMQHDTVQVKQKNRQRHLNGASLNCLNAHAKTLKICTVYTNMQCVYSNIHILTCSEYFYMSPSILFSQNNFIFKVCTKLQMETAVLQILNKTVV